MSNAQRVSSVEAPSVHGSIKDEAADWLSRRERGLSPVEQEQFSAWLLSDPRHAAAAKQIEASWRFLQKPRFTGQTEEVLRDIEARVVKRTRRRRAWLSMTGLAAAAALVFAFGQFRDFRSAAPIVAGAMHLKPQIRTLADGSVVELNASAEIAVDFTDTQRSVTLLRGTAHFAVAKNPSRPFVVTAGGVSVRAVGTEFSVRFDPKEVDVLVTEGRVAVERSPEPVPSSVAAVAVVPAPTFLNAGNRILIPIDVPAAPLQVQPASAPVIQTAQAWRTKRVEFSDMPLSEIVVMFNSQNQIQLAVDGKTTGDVRISGIFWVDDPEGFSRLLESSAGLKARQPSSGRILLEQP